MRTKRQLAKCYVLLTIAMWLAIPIATAHFAMAKQVTHLDNESWRSAISCGTNALYLLMRSHGEEVSLKDVQSVLTPGPRGVSMHQIRIAAKSFGLEVEVFQCTPEQLQEVGMPVIILPEPPENRNYGHYMLATSVNPDAATMIDPISTVVSEVPQVTFQRAWSGYGIRATRESSLKPILLPFGFIATIVSLAATYWMTRPPLLKSATLSTLILIFGAGGGFSGADCNAGERPYRLRTYGGVTVPLRTRTQLNELAQKCRFGPDASMGALLHSARLPDDHNGVTDGQNNLDEPTSLVSFDQDRIVRLLPNRENLYERIYPDRVPLAAVTPGGARFLEVSWSPSRGERRSRHAHLGQTLSVLAELAVPIETTVHCSGVDVALTEFVRDARLNYSPVQEPYWTLIAFSLYEPNVPQWTDKYGRVHSFKAIFSDLLAQKPGSAGPCAGTHALYLFAAFVQLEQLHPDLLEESQWSMLGMKLKEAVITLAGNQLADGSWRFQWYDGSEPRWEVETRLSSITERLWITGHLLEWQALLPPKLRMDNIQLRQAIHFIVRHTSAIEPKYLQSHPCKFIHGVRASQLLTRVENI